MGQAKLIYTDTNVEDSVKYSMIKGGELFNYCSKVYLKTKHGDTCDGLDISMYDLSVSHPCEPDTEVLRVEMDISIKLIDRT